MTNESELKFRAAELARKISGSIHTVTAEHPYSLLYAADDAYDSAVKRHVSDLVAHEAHRSGLTHTELEEPRHGTDEYFLRQGKARAKIHVIKDEDYRQIIIALRDLRRALEPSDVITLKTFAGEEVSILVPDRQDNTKKRRRRRRGLQNEE